MENWRFYLTDSGCLISALARKIQFPTGNPYLDKVKTCALVYGNNAMIDG